MNSCTAAAAAAARVTSSHQAWF